MEKKITILKRFSSFKIVLIYAAVSAVYIFTSDYFLEFFIHDAVLISKVQTLKGLFYRDWETDRKSTRLNSSH